MLRNHKTTAYMSTSVQWNELHKILLWLLSLAASIFYLCFPDLQMPFSAIATLIIYLLFEKTKQTY